MTHAWFDLSAGVAGDMLLGALLDAGAPLDAVGAAVRAVLGDAVALEASEVLRCGQRATKVGVRVLVDDPPHRRWASLRQELGGAALPAGTRERALAAFGRLAEAEGRVHGVPAGEVHFHEVGALDSIADVVGCCEALRLLGVTSVSAGPIAVGDGRVRVAHGDVAVPVPAVAELMRGWVVRGVPGGGRTGGHAHGHAEGERDAGGTDHAHGREHAHGPGHAGASGHGAAHDRPAPVTTPGAVGELATPTGVALVRAWADRCEPLPELAVGAVGVGAGGKDFAGHPNVVRVVVGERPDVSAGTSAGAARHASPGVAGWPAGPADGRAEASELGELRANVDDLDPRVWPGVLDACLAAGAVDAWLAPIVMKKGRPAFTVHALVRPDAADAVADVLLTHTTTLGVREVGVRRRTLERAFVTVEIDGVPLTVKVGGRAGAVVHAAAEFDSLAEVAARLGRPEAEVAQRAAAAIVAAGWVAGARMPA